MLKPFYIKKKNINNRLVPPVSAADAGKLLGVDEEGNITLVEVGSGDSPEFFIITVDYNPRTQTGTCDKTFSEIDEAVKAGKIPIGIYKNGDLIYDTNCHVNVASAVTIFSISPYSDSNFLIDRFKINRSNVLSYAQITVTGTAV